MKGSPEFSSRDVKTRGLVDAVAGLSANLRRSSKRPLLSEGRVKVLSTGNTVWLVIRPATDVHVVVRLCGEPHPFEEVAVRLASKSRIIGRIRGGLGRYHIEVTGEDLDWWRMRVRVILKTRGKTLLVGRSRDVCLLDQSYEPVGSGLVSTKQTGPIGGHAFVSGGSISLFYFQNLSALGPVTRLGGASMIGSVDVEWPQIGFRMPESPDPLPAGCELVLSDAFLRIGPEICQSESKRGLVFLDHLAAVYRQLPVPRTEWFDWSKQAARTVRDVERSGDCLRRHDGVTYVNAYVGSIDKPPESMVQGAVRVPLAEYEEWLGKPVKLAGILKDSQVGFFDQEMGYFLRWLPGCPFGKEEPSEEEVHGRIDSWYLLHSLMNIARLAELGRGTERELFLKALGYVVRVARHFDHDWPVFFDQKSLRVFKNETGDGKGGEQDAPGLYAHLMMQAWRLTREPVYLAEAENAADRLGGLGFGVLYQTNNTMFSAVALAWLWKEAGNTRYRELAMICVSSILSHLWMWEPGDSCRPWQTFMGLPPLHDAPYLAAYEEAEVMAAIEAYLKVMEDELPDAVVFLLMEYWRHLLHRAKWYFPDELPEDAICAKPREGFINRKLAVPVEDIYPSREQAGQVGQEVYGAALALILTTRTHHRWKEIPFDVWTDAPMMRSEFRESGHKRSGCVEFRLSGTAEQQLLVRILPRMAGKSQFKFKVRAGPRGGACRSRRPLANPEGHPLFRVPGGAEVRIAWEKLPSK